MMYLTDAQAAEFFAMRRALDGYVSKITENPAEINENMCAIRQWEPGAYSAETSGKPADVRMFEGVPYKCKQSHDSTSNPDWTPAATAALWGHYHGTTPETARPFEADAANMYEIGEYATENGKIWLNNYDGNVYSPSVLPERWTYVRDV